MGEGRIRVNTPSHDTASDVGSREVSLANLENQDGHCHLGTNEDVSQTMCNFSENQMDSMFKFFEEKFSRAGNVIDDMQREIDSLSAENARLRSLLEKEMAMKKPDIPSPPVAKPSEEGAQIEHFRAIAKRFAIEGLQESSYQLEESAGRKF